MTNLYNSRKIYLAPNPDTVKETFVYMGRRYFLLCDIALISEENKYHFCPPPDRGFYWKIPIKDFNTAKNSYLKNKAVFLKENGYLKSGGQKAFDF